MQTLGVKESHNEPKYHTLHLAARALKEQLQQHIYGQNEVLNEVVVTVLSGSHALLTGSPGVAKTTLVRHLAESLGSNYKRIQFTSDLTPFDIIGGESIVFDEINPDLKRIVFQPGPLFAPFILADEINRASPRTQSALLEAMQERQVSIMGKTHLLPKPFFVFATQNPLENEGTFPLPEAQLDRFLLNISVPYPNFEAEVKIAQISSKTTNSQPLQGADILLNARALVETFPISPVLAECAVRIVRNSRPECTELDEIKQWVQFGASPRAAQALIIGAKAMCILENSSEVSFEHIQKIGLSVLRHRIAPNFTALSENKNSDFIAKFLLEKTLL
jgi:MoxR-like ATPase